MKTLTFDIETTGLPEKGHEYSTHFLSFPNIVTLAYKVNAEETKYFIINQEGKKLSEENMNIHHISNEDCEASPHFLFPTLAAMLLEGQGADKVIGHNIYFDTSIIKANILKLYYHKRIEHAFFMEFSDLIHKDKRIDTMRKTIKFCNLPGTRGPNCPKYPKLSELYSKLFNKTFNAHNAKEDVDACYECYVELVKLGVI